MQIERGELFGARLAVTDYQSLLNISDDIIASPRGAPVRYNFCNVHVVMMCQENPALKAAVNHPQALSVTDGMPLVWGLRQGGVEMRERVYGPTFFEKALRHRPGEIRHFFYGSTPEIQEALIAKAKKEIPNICVAGTFLPPFRPLTDEEETALVNTINASKAHIVWVCLGAPKQEIFIDRIACRCQVPIMAAVGAAFAFYAGHTPQAPKALQKLGLEWLFRLLMEPKRLFVRYFKYNPWYLWLLFLSFLSRRKIVPSREEI